MTFRIHLGVATLVSGILALILHRLIAAIGGSESVFLSLAAALGLTGLAWSWFMERRVGFVLIGASLVFIAVGPIEGLTRLAAREPARPAAFYIAEVCVWSVLALLPVLPVLNYKRKSLLVVLVTACVGLLGALWVDIFVMPGRFFAGLWPQTYHTHYLLRDVAFHHLVSSVAIGLVAAAIVGGHSRRSQPGGWQKERP